VNELGVVYLFGVLSDTFDFKIESIQSGFPDCVARRKKGKNRWEEVRIEFEYDTKSFLALFLAAPDSRAPVTLRILGVVTLVADLATPLFGLKRFHRVFDWWAALRPAFKRAWAGCALAFGLLLFYAVVP